MRRVLPALLLASAIAATGCLEPYRVRIDADVLAQANGWVEVHEKVKGAWLEPRTQETRYTFDPTTTSAPFPGTLQVFSVRSLTGLSQDELLRLADKAVEDGAERHAIALDGASRQGHRTLASGVRTQWVLRAGTTVEPDPRGLFDEQVRIQILAEVGHDGKSDTSFLAVGIVQVERAQQCPLNACAPVHSEATWIQVVGDPDGSVEGATSDRGFIDHLETR